MLRGATMEDEPDAEVRPPPSSAFGGGFQGNGGGSSGRPTGMIPLHPSPSHHASFPTFLGHSLSLPQSAGFFPLDSLPTSGPSESKPLSSMVSHGGRNPPSSPPFPRQESGFPANVLLPGHLRSLGQEIPFRPSSQLCARSSSGSPGEILGFGQVKPEMGWNGGEGDNVDDLIDSYMNLDGPNSAAMEDSKHGGSKSTVAGNETESGGLNGSRSSGTTTSEQQMSRGTVKEKDKGKSSSTGDVHHPNAGVTSHHCRSLSMDSLMGNLSFTDEPLKPGLLPERTCIPFGSDLKKITANAKLAEIALHDPKRAKRILANRQSAARSKERKIKYVSELEQKVQILQREAATLSEKLTLLQRDAAGLASQNNELRLRLQAMDQQAQLRDALSEALSSEVQRLKLLNAELGQCQFSNNLNRQLTTVYVTTATTEAEAEAGAGAGAGAGATAVDSFHAVHPTVAEANSQAE